MTSGSVIASLWGMPQQQPKQNSVSEVLKHLYVHGTLVSQAVQAQ